VYQFGQMIGQGRYGIVSLAVKHISKTRPFAIKSVPRDRVKRDVYMLEQELEILQTVDHPNNISFFEIYQDPKYFHFVTEFCKGGDLFEYIMDRGCLYEREAAFLTIKLVSAIKHLHDKNICHRDLKPENILFEYLPKAKSPRYPEIKVIDYGLSKHFKESGPHMMNTKLGTPYYVCPEILEGIYSKICDMWSVGVIVYVMLCGYPPFNAHNELKLFAKIQRGDYHFVAADWRDISNEAKAFVRQLIEIDPSKRLTPDQALRHPWILKYKNEYLDSYSIDCRVLERLAEFEGLTRFKALGLHVLQNLLLRKQKTKIKHTFQALNTSLSGSLSFEEILAGYASCEVKCDQEKLRETFNQLDKDGDGFLSLTDFCIGALDKESHLNDKFLKQAFQILDTTQSGRITGSNLKQYFLRRGILKDQDELESIFREIGHCSQAGINFESFCEVLTSNGQTAYHSGATISELPTDEKEEKEEEEGASPERVEA